MIPQSNQSPSPGHLEAKAAQSLESLKVRLIAEVSGIGLFEESKKGLVYGYTLAVMPATNKEYGRNAFYLPNWVKDYACAAMPKLAAELAKPKAGRRALREVMRLHQAEWQQWISERDPLRQKEKAPNGPPSRKKQGLAGYEPPRKHGVGVGNEGSVAEPPSVFNARANTEVRYAASTET
jgi:hypothetical protein